MPKISVYRALFWLLSFTLCVVIVLFADENTDREFLKNSRDELKRLKEISQKPDNVSEVGDSPFARPFKQAPVLPMPGIRTLSAIQEKMNNESQSSDKENNWLLSGINKLSGVETPTDEEKKDLLEMKGELSLLDRFVLEQELTKNNDRIALVHELDDESNGDIFEQSNIMFGNRPGGGFFDLGNIESQSDHTFLGEPSDLAINPYLDNLERYFLTIDLRGNAPLSLNMQTDHNPQDWQLPSTSATSGLREGSKSLKFNNSYLRERSFAIELSGPMPGRNENLTSKNKYSRPDRLSESLDPHHSPVNTRTVNERTYKPPEDNLKKW